MLALKLNFWGSKGFGIEWKEKDSLRETVRGIFPLNKGDEDPPSMPIKKSKLSARYLHDYAKVKLVWTDNLSEHLMLNTERARKELRIFQYVSLLEAAMGRTGGREIEVESDKELQMEG